MTTDYLDQMNLCEAAQAVAQGEVSSQQLTEYAINRLKEIGPKLNCVVSIHEEKALDSAYEADKARSLGKPLGPLHGVPLAHKELFYRQGIVSNDGSIISKGFIPTETSTALTRLDQAGAIDVGQLHMAEFAMSPTGFNLHYGHVKNPWNVDYCPGGSSSGSGAAVAARLVFGSLGTDTGGSIRHPAAMCGVTGIKPTWSRVSSYGVMPLSVSLDCAGPIARTARDCARLLSIIAGFDSNDLTSSTLPVPRYEDFLTGQLKGVKIAVPGGYYEQNQDEGVAQALKIALDTFKNAGAQVIHTQPPDIDFINRMMGIVLTVEAAAHHQAWIRERSKDYAPQVLARFKPGFEHSGIQYFDAISLRSKLTNEWLKSVLGDADVAFMPTIPVSVPSIAETTEGDWGEISKKISFITHCNRGINYLGLPAISTPAGFSHDMPVAFQLVGRHFDEAKLLMISDAYQKLTDWHTRFPLILSNNVN